VVFRDSRSTLTCILLVDKHVAIMPRYSSSYWEVVVCHTVEEEESNSLVYFILFMAPPPRGPHVEVPPCPPHSPQDMTEPSSPFLGKSHIVSTCYNDENVVPFLCSR